MEINVKLAINKGLIKFQDFSLYEKLRKYYRYAFEFYLNSMINFSEYENEIYNSGLYFGINPTFKGINEYLNLDFIFFINDLFVEKLDKNDIETILNTFKYGTVSNEILNIVKRTYKDVVKNNFKFGNYSDENYRICYGDPIPYNFVDNDSLVFRIYYGRNTIKLSDKEYIELHDKQINFLKNLIIRLKNDIERKTELKCNILFERII